MLEHVIEYNGKKYPVKEPTIKTWSEVMKLRDILNEGELFVKVIELVTGLSQDEIMKADAPQVKKVGEQVITLLTSSNKNVVRNFTFKGKDYQYLDINTLSFGQYIDIDTFLSKDENYRKQNLNELAAYLYIEKGTKYGEAPIQERIREFEDLPIKYLEGGVFFLLSIARASEELTRIYSKSKMLRVIMKLKIILRLTGVGIQQSAHLVKTKYGYLTMLVLYPLLSASIILPTLWITIRNKKKR